MRRRYLVNKIFLFEVNFAQLHQLRGDDDDLSSAWRRPESVHQKVRQQEVAQVVDAEVNLEPVNALFSSGILTPLILFGRP